MGTTILDINYVDVLQFQRYFTPQAELEEAFIYIIHVPIDISRIKGPNRPTVHRLRRKSTSISIDISIDFSYRLKALSHMVIDLKQVRVPIGS